MCKISIIVPVYNASKWLENCIRSVQLQTIKDVEMICIDDGSTDETGTILERLSQEDSRLKIYKQSNQGAGKARNAGMKLAKGKYLAFLDADDYFLDVNALEKMYQACEEQQVKICGGFRCTDRDGKISQMDMHRSECQGLGDGRQFWYHDYQYDYHYQNYIYSREMLLTNNIMFPDYRRFQDPPFFVKAMITAKEFYVVPVEYYCFRSGHQDYNFNERKVNDIVKGLIDNLEISAKEGLKQLHVLTVDRINDIFYWDIIQQLKGQNVELIRLLIKANQMVRWKWLDNKEVMLKPLQFLLEASEQYITYIGSQVQQRNQYGWLFPFERIPAGSRIVLYAAGNVGQAYYQQLKDRAEYQLVLWVDKNVQKFNELDFPIAMPDKIQEVVYDVIVIAVEERRTANAIVADLKRCGIDENRIIWGNA